MLPNQILREMPKVLTIKSANANIVKFEYAVRGRLAIRSEQLKEQLSKDPKSLPFNKIVNCNIGNPQSLGQKPITFYRQVAAMIEYPELEKMAKFPADVVARANELLKAMGGSVGAYSSSQGVPLVRKRVAEFIKNRDGFPADFNSIFCTTGASEGVKALLQILISKENVGIMIPVPQYPLYTATVSINGGRMVPYYLDESKDWSMSTQELEMQLQKARSEGTEVRALCVINPGNPTGQCLDEESMKAAIKFCKKNNLVLLADEVYQENVYEPNRPFISFKKVLFSMGYEKEIELVSFHSISKGLIGECGRRGGYFECVNIDEDVKALLYKMISVSLCSPVQGQVMLELMVNPPKKGDPSYELFRKENDDIYESLKRRAQKIQSALNTMEGVSCNKAQGAMYLFPKVTLSIKAVEMAKKEGMQPDEYYCMQLLNKTGVVFCIN
jgi:alanine transaminase